MDTLNEPPQPSQLDRIEEHAAKTVSRLDQLWARVDRLEYRATFWGAVSGAVMMALTKLLGACS